MAKATYSFHSSATIPSDEVLQAIVTCMAGFMRVSDAERWQDKLQERSQIFVQWVTTSAEPAGDVIAFKAGYELRPGLFYSWLGGVAPEHRRQGLAKRLMTEQHQFAESAGCREVRTITTNDHRAMMIMNLNAGFDIVETKQRGDELRIVMAKQLGQAAN